MADIIAFWDMKFQIVKQSNNQECKSKYVPEYHILNDYLWVYDGGGGAIYDSVS